MSRNPSPFGGTDSHRSLLLLIPAFSFERGPLDFTAKLLPTPDASLLDYLSVLQSIGGRLSPVHFQDPQSRLVICYELFKGRLLLSPPSSCLRLRIPFNLTLSRHLGTLTPGRVLALSDAKLTPAPSLLVSKTILSSEFDRVPRAFAPEYPISALPYCQSPPRPTCE